MIGKIFFVFFLIFLLCLVGHCFAIWQKWQISSQVFRLIKEIMKNEEQNEFQYSFRLLNLEEKRKGTAYEEKAKGHDYF